MDDKAHERIKVHEKKKAMLIQCDTQGAISFMKNVMQHVRTKHIDVQHHFVWEQVENGEKLPLNIVQQRTCVYQGITKITR